MTYKRKLIEVALPLEAINTASQREGYIYRANPSAVHKWWSRKPLAACRALLFAQLVDDPSARPDRFATDVEQEGERQRLFRIIEDLVKWENTTNEEVLERARAEIRESCKPPLPPDTDDAQTMLAFAELFNGYDHWGGFDECSSRANHIRERFAETGIWNGSFDDLRGTLFFLARAYHHTSMGSLAGWDDHEFLPLYAEIRRRWNEVKPELPPVLDPFCGGGSIPLEAQRLGLEAHGSDLNPVAVLITKALIEVPPKFADRPPVNPKSRASLAAGGTWRGAAGLAEDVRYYGQWIRDEAEKRIGHLYPKEKLPDGTEATVIAWLWARTVECPNPACKAKMPLASKYWLSKKAGREAWVEPIVDREAKTVRFEVRTGTGGPQDAPKTGRGAQFRCLVCAEQCPDLHIKSEGRAGRMGSQLMAVAVEGDRGRVYLDPTPGHVGTAEGACPAWAPTEPLVDDHRSIWCYDYGLTTFDKLFTRRQLVALTTFSDLVGEAVLVVAQHAAAAGMPDGGVSLEAGGSGATAYAGAVGTYLAFAVSKCSQYSCALVPWYAKEDRPQHAFARQALPMVWDYAEINPLGTMGGTLAASAEIVAGSLAGVCADGLVGTALARDVARGLPSGVHAPVLCTDPPYYSNIGYADLSDFFYVWLRRMVGGAWPALFRTMLVPKTEELVAAAHRFAGGRADATRFFEEGLGRAFSAMRQVQHTSYPLVVYYAFKQEESDALETDAAPATGHESTVGEPVDALPGRASTGWETMLSGLLDAGFLITGTWPIRTERTSRSRGYGTNALASSIVLVCRQRQGDAPTSTRREFLSALRTELPEALRRLQQGNVAPVDFAQAAIGPGMGVFSRYTQVLEADGGTMGVRTALQIINQELDAFLAEQEGDVDPDTRFCIAWYEQYGLEEAEFGGADVLARAKNTSVSGLVEAGVLHASAGKVRLRRRSEYPEDWQPGEDARVPVWEATQHLIRAMESGGEAAAADLAARLGGALADEARALAYRLYSLSDRKGWAQEALAYNSLVTGWPEMAKLTGRDTQGSLFG